jgi:hypothetical protein
MPQNYEFEMTTSFFMSAKTINPEMWDQMQGARCAQSVTINPQYSKPENSVTKFSFPKMYKILSSKFFVKYEHSGKTDIFKIKKLSGRVTSLVLALGGHLITLVFYDSKESQPNINLTKVSFVYLGGFFYVITHLSSQMRLQSQNFGKETCHPS